MLYKIKRKDLTVRNLIPAYPSLTSRQVEDDETYRYTFAFTRFCLALVCVREGKKRNKGEKVKQTERSISMEDQPESIVSVLSHREDQSQNLFKY